MKKLFGIVSFVASLAVFSNAHAGDLNRLQNLSQSEFHWLTQDLGAAFSYKPLTPTEPLGIAGFDVGVAVEGTNLQHASVYEKAGAGDYSGVVAQPSIRINKGLPFNFDIGLMASTALDSNIRVLGGELRYAFVPGNVALPAIGVRAAYTQIIGVNQLDFNTKSLDLSLSKGFAMVTPYAGIGRVWTSGKANDGVALADESPSLNKFFIGANINLGLINLDFEGDRTGSATSYGLKFGFRF